MVLGIWELPPMTDPSAVGLLQCVLWIEMGWDAWEPGQSFCETGCDKVGSWLGGWPGVPQVTPLEGDFHLCGIFSIWGLAASENQSVPLGYISVTLLTPVCEFTMAGTLCGMAGCLLLADPLGDNHITRRSFPDEHLFRAEQLRCLPCGMITYIRADLTKGTTGQTSPQLSGLRQQPFLIFSRVYGLARQFFRSELGLIHPS